jgi:hypothetical protein
VGISSVHRCPQMPTDAHKIEHFWWRFLCNFMELFAWTVCYGWRSSVPYILPNSLIILTAKACMKLFLIVWLWNALTSVMLESTLEIKLMQFCHSFFLSNISVNDSSSPIFENFEFEIHSHLLNYLNLRLFLQTLCKRWMDGLICWTQFLSGTMRVLEMALCFSYCEIGVYLSHCVLQQHPLRLPLACVMGANTKWVREAKGGRWVRQKSSWEEISAERKDRWRETQASSPVFRRSKISLSGFVKLITLQSSVEWVYCFPRSVLWHLV